MPSRPTRRGVLAGLSGALLSGWSDRSQAAARRLPALIAAAAVYPTVSQRIEAISRALLGTRYAAHTLIGSPRRLEVFVVREDAFDCVTYCEVVLAAALARNLQEFEDMLRRIRYRNGEVSWRERNHYFADWCENNVANGICRRVDIGTPVRIDKSSDSEPGLGRRRWTLNAIPRTAFLRGAIDCRAGDIVGFVSRRANLDYFHTGFVMFGARGTFLLRHASSTRLRVLDEPMERFIAVNGVRYVTLLRPQERAAEPPRQSRARMPA